MIRAKLSISEINPEVDEPINANANEIRSMLHRKHKKIIINPSVIGTKNMRQAAKLDLIALKKPYPLKAIRSGANQVIIMNGMAITIIL